MKKILIKPIITEKSMRLVTEGHYMFEVEKSANKKEIAKEINRVFGVDVVSVRVHIRPGKTRRVARRRQTTRSASRKFAVATLKKGQRIVGFDEVLEIEESEE